MQWKKLSIPHELEPAWLIGSDIRLPVKETSAPSVKMEKESVVFNFDAEEVIRVLQEETYAGKMSSPTLKLPFSYVSLPPIVRLIAAKSVYLPKRLFRKRRYPPWPFAQALDVLLYLSGKLPDSLWGKKKWGLSITHDVDTVNGLKRCLKIADEVETAGFRSCFYIVGSVILKEPGIVRELHERGHEIGSHDVEHDNRLCSLTQEKMEDRIRQARSIIESYEGVGFRSPSLLRSADMIGLLGKHFKYDSSICDTDLEYYRGCTTVFPYNLHGCIEIPITLPMDSSLKYIGYSPFEMLELWKSKCNYIRSVGGFAVFVNHAEPHLSGKGPLLKTFKYLLKWLREQPDLIVTLPSEAARTFFICYDS